MVVLVAIFFSWTMIALIITGFSVLCLRTPTRTVMLCFAPNLLPLAAPLIRDYHPACASQDPGILPRQSRVDAWKVVLEARARDNRGSGRLAQRIEDIDTRQPLPPVLMLEVKHNGN